MNLPDELIIAFIERIAEGVIRDQISDGNYDENALRNYDILHAEMHVVVDTSVWEYADDNEDLRMKLRTLITEYIKEMREI